MLPPTAASRSSAAGAASVPSSVIWTAPSAARPLLPLPPSTREAGGNPEAGGIPAAPAAAMDAAVT